MGILDKWFGNKEKEKGFSYVCPGCGRRLKTTVELEAHISQCQKFKQISKFTYVVPEVTISDIPKLEARLLPDNRSWGIWNNNTNDWVKDKSGQIDSRMFKSNIHEFLKCVITASIIASAKKGDLH